MRPNADVALMLGLVHTLSKENLTDKSFLQTHFDGFDKFRDYLHCYSDGIDKNADRAASICDAMPSASEYWRGKWPLSYACCPSADLCNAQSTAINLVG